MKKLLALLLLLTLCMLPMGCALSNDNDKQTPASQEEPGDTQTPQNDPQPDQPEEQPQTDQVAAYLATFTAGKYGVSNSTNPIVEFTFEGYGTVRVELYPDVAPLSVANFLSYVDEGFYDGTIMHRIIAGFMIQGGGYYLNGNYIVDKETKDPIKGEFASNGVTNDIKHTFGVLSMARATGKNTATSQFFICSATASHLDGDYAAFGKIIDEQSAAVVLAVSQADTVYVSASFADFPYPPVTLTSVRVLRR